MIVLLVLIVLCYIITQRVIAHLTLTLTTTKKKIYFLHEGESSMPGTHKHLHGKCENHDYKKLRDILSHNTLSLTNFSLTDSQSLNYSFSQISHSHSLTPPPLSLSPSTRFCSPCVNLWLVMSCCVPVSVVCY